MTVEVAQRRTRKPKARPVESLAIGEIDQTVFACPGCARPLALGARRCPGCGTRLILGVKAQRASIFVSAGVVAGLVVAGVFGAVTSALDSAGRDAAAAAIAAAAAASASPSPTATAAPTASPTTVPGTGSNSSVPALTRSALGQAVAVNERLATSAAAFAAALAAPTFDTFVASQILRATSADAVYGLQLTRHISAWSGGKALSDELTEFYAAVQETAAEGLSASIRNDTAYKAAAQRMLDLLGGIDELDERVRDVATDADVELTPAP